MAKKKNIRTCPNCGSRNLQAEGHSKKGRILYICSECDHEFEIRAGNESDRWNREDEDYAHS